MKGKNDTTSPLLHGGRFGHRHWLRIHKSFTLRVFATVLVSLLVPFVLRAQFTFVTNNGAITITGYSGPGGTSSSRRSQMAFQSAKSEPMRFLIAQT